MAKKTALQISGVERTYGQGEHSLSILKNANFELRSGEIVALVAPSGTGKSTLLHLLGLMEQPSSGKLRIQGVEVQSLKGRKESYDTNMVGRVAQNPSRLPYMEVFSQYQKMMEEALTKEPIPFNYREQVKEYFRSLENR